MVEGNESFVVEADRERGSLMTAANTEVNRCPSKRDVLAAIEVERPTVDNELSVRRRMGENFQVLNKLRYRARFSV
jgi:hypothetical protein